MKWLDKHFKLLWVLVVLTSATVASFVALTILCFERELQYLPGTIATGVLSLVELIIWVNLFKWIFKKEREVNHEQPKQ